MSDNVEVFSFYWYDPNADTSVLSPTKRERAPIVAMGLVPLDETKELVSRDDLDDNGRYHPKA